MQFFIFKTVRCLWLKRCYTITLILFALIGTASPVKKTYKKLHSTKNLIKENLNQTWFFKLENWNNRHIAYWFLQFMLGCRFSFEAYAKNVREKVTKFSLETTEVLLDADGHVLT